MAEARDIPSDEMLFRGFPKSPIVLLNRLDPSVNSIRVNKNPNLILIGSGKRKRDRPTLKNIKSLSTSRRKRKNTKRFKCKTCNKTFKKSSHQKNHYKFKHANRKFICSYCSKKYVRETFFKRHFALHCKICFALQTNETQLIDHISFCKNKQSENQAVEEIIYKCDLCEDHFNSNCALSYHKASIHSNNTPSIKDLYYTRVFGTTKVYVCYFCKESTVDKEYLDSHVNVLRSMIPLDIKYPCNHCQESFDTENDLLEHKLSHLIVGNNLQDANNEIEENPESIPQPIIINVVKPTNTNEIQTVTNNISEKEKSSDTRVISNIEQSKNTSHMGKEQTNNSDRTTSFVKPRIANVEKSKNTIITHFVKPRIINIVGNINKTSKPNVTNIEKPNKGPQRNTEGIRILQNIKYEPRCKNRNKETDINTMTSLKKSTTQSNRINTYHCKMCEKYFPTNFALLRHMKVHHILQSLSCKLCKQVLSTTQTHKCPELAQVITKPEVDSVCSEDCNDMDIDYPVCESTPPSVPQPVTHNIKNLQEDLVFNIVFREVPIEF